MKEIIKVNTKNLPVLVQEASLQEAGNIAKSLPDEQISIGIKQLDVLLKLQRDAKVATALNVLKVRYANASYVGQGGRSDLTNKVKVVSTSSINTRSEADSNLHAEFPESTTKNWRKLGDDEDVVIEKSKKLDDEGTFPDTKAVVNEIRTEQVAEQVKAENEHYKANPPKAIDGRYDLIVIDPPWPSPAYNKNHFEVGVPYGQMTLGEIRDIHLPLKEDGWVFLWGIDKYLEYTLNPIIPAWNLERRATIVWDKIHMKIGVDWRFQHEFCFVCRRGKPKRPHNAHIRTVINEPCTSHSRKPDKLYDIIDEHFPTLSKLDYFARERKRDGWDRV